MGLRDAAAKLAAILRQKLTAEEFSALVDLDGDYTTSDWLLKELCAARSMPAGGDPPSRIGELSGEHRGSTVSVQPEWCRRLPVQQQSVLLLASRGPDGVAKVHPCKPVVIAYRASVLVAAKYGRSLGWGEKADTFMSLDVFATDNRASHSALMTWSEAKQQFFDHHDVLPKHYLAHLMHGVEILGYKHPDERFRSRWLSFYVELVDSLHLQPETEAQMDVRLGDWGRAHW
jgi:hypothetical protein